MRFDNAEHVGRKIAKKISLRENFTGDPGWGVIKICGGKAQRIFCVPPPSAVEKPGNTQGREFRLPPGDHAPADAVPGVLAHLEAMKERRKSSRDSKPTDGI